MKISIITVTFNSAATIADCIASVNDQIYPDVDHIVVDGASQDNTVEIIRSAPNRVTTLISEPDQGMYDAMNKGIMAATGDVVGILNSDDYFTSNDVLSAVARAFQENQTDAVIGDVHFVRPDNPHKCVRYYSSAIFRPFLFRFGFMPAHPSFYMRRSIYLQHGLYPTGYQIAADYDLLIRYLYHHKVCYHYLPLDFVTMRTGGASTRNINSRVVLNREIVQACRNYGIYTNMFLLSMKYFVKVFELKPCPRKS